MRELQARYRAAADAEKRALADISLRVQGVAPDDRGALGEELEHAWQLPRLRKELHECGKDLLDAFQSRLIGAGDVIAVCAFLGARLDMRNHWALLELAMHAPLEG